MIMGSVSVMVDTALGLMEADVFSSMLTGDVVEFEAMLMEREEFESIHTRLICVFGSEFKF
jgi:hypothetical protein